MESVMTSFRFAPLVAAFVILTPASAIAHEYKAGSLHIGHPWARATPKGAKVAGGYMKITNNGTEPDRLLGGSSLSSGRFEIHEMRTENGVMHMRPLPKGLEIRPGATVELKPGSFHIMFMELKEPFQEGKRVKGSLTFEKAGTVEVEYAVEKVGGEPDHSKHKH
jgi:copper(I)-binding protein